MEILHIIWEQKKKDPNLFIGKQNTERHAFKSYVERNTN